MSEENLSKNNSKIVKIIYVTLLVLIVISVAIAIYYTLIYKNINTNKTIDVAETTKIVEKVGKIIDLPKNEIPTIATVSDISKLSNQPFFERAKNGDQVLFYTEAKKAYIYDPKNNIIVEVASLNVGK
jgi:hypothetical protein